MATLHIHEEVVGPESQRQTQYMIEDNQFSVTLYHPSDHLPKGDINCPSRHPLDDPDLAHAISQALARAASKLARLQAGATN